MQKIIILLLLALASAELHGQWKAAEGSGGHFSSYLETNGILLATSDLGGVYASSDRGRSWTTVPTGLWELSFATTSIVQSGDRLFVSAEGGGVGMSSDGGLTWSAANNGFPNQAFVTSLAVVGDSLYASMMPMMFAGEIFRTAIDSIDWKRADAGLPVSTAIVNDIAVSRSGALFICFSTDVVRRAENVYVSFDGADSWQPIPVEQAVNVYALVADGDDLYAVADSGIYMLTSGGVTWRELGDLPSVTPLSMAIRGEEIYAGTIDNGILRSTDGGESWSGFNEGLPVENDLPLAIWTDGRVVVSSLAIGDHAWYRVLETSGRENEIDRGNLALDLTSRMTEGATTIGYTLPAAGEVTLRVYSLLGQEVKTIDEGWKSEGRHQIMLDTHGLAPGAYMVNLETGGRRVTRRMVVGG